MSKKKQTPTYKFTVDGEDYIFSCNEKDLVSYIAKNYPQYQGEWKNVGTDMYSMDEREFIIIGTRWEADPMNPYKGEKKTFEVTLYVHEHINSLIWSPLTFP